MKALKNWIWSISLNATLAALFYYWQVRGIENAHNLLMFIVWIDVVLFFIAAAGGVEGHKQKDQYHNPAALRWFARACTVALIVALVWYGHPVAAGCYLVAWVCLLAVSEATKAQRP